MKIQPCIEWVTQQSDYSHLYAVPHHIFTNFYSIQWPIKSTGFCQGKISVLSLDFFCCLFVLPKTWALICQSGVTCKIFLPSKTELKFFYGISGRGDRHENFLLVAKVTGEEVGESISADSLEVLHRLYTFLSPHYRFHWSIALLHCGELHAEECKGNKKSGSTSHVGIQMLTSEETILCDVKVQWRHIWNTGPSHFFTTKT